MRRKLRKYTERKCTSFKFTYPVLNVFESVNTSFFLISFKIKNASNEHELRKLIDKCLLLVYQTKVTCDSTRIMFHFSQGRLS
uniref:Uncharacterized protein n=1 Tax=Octopus bimaculoides TaxID=37653 RepID=A0A0L8GZB7_OCTBM